MNKVNECPYCGGTFPHQGPTGCNQTGPDPGWMLDEHVTIIAEKHGDNLVVRDIESGITCTITYNSKGRMLFDGFDIETEEFMGFVGIQDAVEDSPNKKVAFKSDMTAEDL